MPLILSTFPLSLSPKRLLLLYTTKPRTTATPEIQQPFNPTIPNNPTMPPTPSRKLIRRCGSNGIQAVNYQQAVQIQQQGWGGPKRLNSTALQVLHITTPLNRTLNEMNSKTWFKGSKPVITVASFRASQMAIAAVSFKVYKPATAAA